jgi:hypothetical protein
MFGRRPDATLVTDASPVRRFMSYISPKRVDGLVYFAQEIDVTAAQALVDRDNANRPKGSERTLFHLLLRAVALALHERPRMNRFTAGGKLWQRNGIWITFSAKKRISDDAQLVTIKREFDPNESLDQMTEGILARLGEGRGERRSTSEKEMSLLLRLPASVVRALLWLAHRADAFGLLPGAMIKSDPLFTSAFVANLGSVGLDAAYHHLWEHGSCPVFCTVGRLRNEADGRTLVTLKWTFDERVEDGLYAARGLALVKERLEKPELL